jgi:hypothetical protein
LQIGATVDELCESLPFFVDGEKPRWDESTAQVDIHIAAFRHLSLL